MFLRHSITVCPANGPASAFIVSSRFMMLIAGSLCRWPIAKSTGSCAGVTFTAPVPNAGSTCSSATTGIIRLVSGSAIVRPTRCRYRSSSGCTAIAVSPSIVSARVVATTIEFSPSP